MKHYLILLGLQFVVIQLFSQADPQLFLGLNQVSTTDRTTIPAGDLTEGMMVFDNTEQLVYFWDGAQWVSLPSSPVRDASDFLSVSYPNAIFSDPGGNNVGCINTINTGAANNYLNAFSWDTAESTAQSYDVLIRYQVPASFQSLQSDWFTLRYTAPSSAGVALTINKEDGTAIQSTTSLPAASIYDTYTLSTTPDISAGDILIINLRLTSVANISAAVSDITINYTN